MRALVEQRFNYLFNLIRTLMTLDLLCGMGMKIAKVATRFLEDLYPKYEVKSINVDCHSNGYEINAEMKERFNPTKRYNASISVTVSIYKY